MDAEEERWRGDRGGGVTWEEKMNVCVGRIWREEDG